METLQDSDASGRLSPSSGVSRVDKVESFANETHLTMDGGEVLTLPPFSNARPGDILTVTRAGVDVVAVTKAVGDGSVPVFPGFMRKYRIMLPPHDMLVTIRDRRNVADWKLAKRLEQFHYRGRGFNRLVGRRIALVVEIDGIGVVGYGILSSTVSSAKPRFALFQNNFTEQMRSGLINRIVRIPRIVIHPEFRGMGIGVLTARALVDYATERWEVNGHRPVLVEVIASMTDYHRFFEAAGFLELGRTGGKDGAVAPTYGNGSFLPRPKASTYEFFADGQPKPYLAIPLDDPTAEKIAQFVERQGSPAVKLALGTPISKDEPLIRLKDVTVGYSAANGSGDRTALVRRAFSVNSDQLRTDALRMLTTDIARGECFLVTGASGSGKSTLLRLLAGSSSDGVAITGTVNRVEEAVVAVLGAGVDKDRPLIDLVGSDAADAIEILNGVGLSEAHLYVKTPSQLSEGQRYRFAVARLVDSGASIWVADEFAANLDPVTAAIVARGIRRAAAERGATLLVASAAPREFLESLGPNQIVKLSWGGEALVWRCKLSLQRMASQVQLVVENRGRRELSGVEIHGIESRRRISQLASLAKLAPRHRHFVQLELEDAKRYSGYWVRTAEGVGDWLYLDQKNLRRQQREDVLAVEIKVAGPA